MSQTLSAISALMINGGAYKVCSSTVGVIYLAISGDVISISLKLENDPTFATEATARVNTVECSESYTALYFLTDDVSLLGTGKLDLMMTLLLRVETYLIDNDTTNYYVELIQSAVD